MKAGAPIDVIDAQGHTELALAVLSRHMDTALCLLQAGANVNASVFRGRFCDPESSISDNENDIGTSIFFQALCTDWEGFAFLLLDYGFPIFTALREATYCAKYAFV